LVQAVNWPMSCLACSPPAAKDELMLGLGTIDLAGTLVIGETAQVEADVAAINIIVGGHVKGNLIASGRVDLLPTGSVTGNVKTGSIAAAEGASLKGEIEIDRRQPRDQMDT
jgi:cytoskeletal protein CcmA (bactofilin family)